jgi:hypothetical protein
MEMGTSRINTLSKPMESSHRRLEEIEDFENMLSQLKNQVDEITESMLKLVDLSSSQECLKN